MRCVVRRRASAASSLSASSTASCDELLDDRLAPRAQGVTAEAAAEALHTGDPDPLQLARVAVQHGEPRAVQNLTDLSRFTRLEVVVAENGRRRNPQRRQLAREHRRLFGQTVVGQIAGDHDDVR